MNDREKWRERVRDIRACHDMMMMMMCNEFVTKCSKILLQRSLQGNVIKKVNAEMNYK